MHGTRDEHPEVFKARMQLHKDQKKQSKQSADSDDTKAKPKGSSGSTESNAAKRQMPLTRKPC